VRAGPISRAFSFGIHHWYVYLAPFAKNNATTHAVATTVRCFSGGRSMRAAMPTTPIAAVASETTIRKCEVRRLRNG
jgi:hypothetical protein